MFEFIINFFIIFVKNNKQKTIVDWSKFHRDICTEHVSKHFI